MIDLESLSLDELRDLRQQLDRSIASYQERKLREAQAAVAEIARQYGFALSQLTAVKPLPARQQAVHVIYANPANQHQKWFGRGRRPFWFRDHVEAGGDPDDLKI